MLQYIPYILLFAVAAAIIYAWGLWRSMRQQQELSNLLCARGVAKVKKALQKNGRMSVQDLEKAVENKGYRYKGVFGLYSSLYDTTENHYGRRGRREGVVSPQEVSSHQLGE